MNRQQIVVIAMVICIPTFMAMIALAALSFVPCARSAALNIGPILMIITGISAWTASTLAGKGRS